jgi:hypothetical protein
MCTAQAIAELSPKTKILPARNSFETDEDGNNKIGK